MKQSIATLNIILKKSFTFFCAVMMVNVAYANPEISGVASGNVSITQSNTTTQINQSSQQAILDWKSFNIGANESTHFAQPAGGVALNRIDASQGASQIYGRLSATGQIILVNGAGIYFGPNAMVNVGSIIASTSGISAANFLAGKYIFDQPFGLQGSVINEGTIKAADYGLVALIGTGVVNNGLIQAQLGNVVLGSGNKFTLDFYGDQLINFTINEAATSAGLDSEGNTLKNGVSNKGIILADGGRVTVSARVAQGVMDDVINMDGYTQARSVDNVNGVIILSGEEEGTVHVSGIVDASGVTGGIIKVLGKAIHLSSTANLNASGDLGGGEILIGGNAHGIGPEQNALFTTVDNGVILKADAIKSGNGGKVIVWSDDNTQFHGSLSAQGGALSGDGGFVETSGRYLDIEGASVNTLAANGLTGNWLLDPTNIYIANTLGNAQQGGMENATPPNQTADSINAGTSQATGISRDSLLRTATLTSALGTSNITVITTNSSGTGVGNIIVVDPFAWSSAHSLTLTAANNIEIRANITTGTAASSLILDAAGSVTQAPPVGLTATIGGSGSLIKQGLGITTLSQANTYSGSTTISNGILSIYADTGLGAAPSVPTDNAIIFNGGKLYTPIGLPLNSNRHIAYTVNAIQITPILSGTAATKTYDGTIAATLTANNYNYSTPSPIINGDIISFNSATSTYDTKNAGSGKLLSATGLSMNATNTTYPGSPFQVYGYNLTSTSASGNIGTINKAALALNAVTDIKVYDGTTSSTGVVTYSGLQTGDTITGLIQVYGSKNVMGTNNSTLNVQGGYTINDDNGGNNYLNTMNNAMGTITPASLSISGVTGNNKVYNANMAAILSGGVLSGVFSGDTVTAESGTGTFIDPNVGVAKAVAATGFILSGADAANYIVTQPSGLTANITPASLTVVTNPASKTYGTNDPTLTYTTTGLYAGDSLTGSLNRTLNSNNENVGAYSILQNTLAASSNYTLSYVGNNLTITPATLTINANPATKLSGSPDPIFTYNASGFINNTVNGIALADSANNVLSGALARQGSSEVTGTYPIVQGSLACNSNYIINYNPANLTIETTTNPAQQAAVLSASNIVSTGFKVSNGMSPTEVSLTNAMQGFQGFNVNLAFFFSQLNQADDNSSEAVSEEVTPGSCS